MPYSHCPVGFFRLFICHDPEGLPLAIELREQLRAYGIAAFVAHERGQVAPSASDRARTQHALQEMDGLVALITRQFSTNAWCNQELGFALGKGSHLQCIALANSAPGLAMTSPQLAMPTDFDLPSLISKFVARDPLVSERLVQPTVEQLLQQPSDKIEHGLRYLECISWPGDGGAEKLRKARSFLTCRISPEVLRRLDRLIERWQDAIPETQCHATIQLASRPNRSAHSRDFVSLIGPI